MKGILKGPLAIAAIVTVLRVIVEQVGLPNIVASLLSVVALHFVICPVYFAIQIGNSDVNSPYLTELKLVAQYVVLARLMLLPVYWLARVFEWPQSRFAGLWGPNSSALIGFVAVPFLTAGFWIVASIVVGGILGTVIIAVRDSARKPRSAA